MTQSMYESDAADSGAGAEVPPAIPADGRILFHTRDRASFGFLSNFHPAPIHLDGEEWATSEHYYQAQKSADPEYRRRVREARTPGKAKRLGVDPELPRRFSHSSWFRKNGTAFRPDWNESKVEVMRRVVRAKFGQNAELRERLLATGEAELVEDSGKDSFWGTGRDGSGTNWLGRVLMEVRAELAGGGVPEV